MTFELHSYSPRFTRIRAIRVDDENFYTIASKFGLVSSYYQDSHQDPKKYLVVSEKSYDYEIVTAKKAHIGDWIVSDGTRFRVCTDAEFTQNFLPTEEASEFQDLFDLEARARNFRIRDLFRQVTKDPNLIEEWMKKIRQIL